MYIQWYDRELHRQYGRYEETRLIQERFGVRITKSCRRDSYYN